MGRRIDELLLSRLQPSIFFYLNVNPAKIQHFFYSKMYNCQSDIKKIMISWAKSLAFESLGPENTEAVSFDLSEDIDISFDLVG
jgi:hypothetical protein